MNSQEKSYYKQEKVLRMLFLVLIFALGTVFYNTYFSKESEKATNSALLPATTRLLEGPVCVLNKQQKITVDSLMPSLCCLNRKQYQQ